MSNSYNISMAPLIAGVQTVVNVTGVMVTAIHDVDLPAVDAVVDAIRATDITTITDAITAKKVRGEFKLATNLAITSEYVEMLNLTSTSGKIVCLRGECGATTEQRIQITVDGGTPAEAYLIADEVKFIGIDLFNIHLFTLKGYDIQQSFFIEFNDSLLLEHKRTSGSNMARCTILYQED